MITKFFAAKADGVDNTNKNISVLLNADNELFVGSDEDALREYFGADAYAGKVAYEDSECEIFHAAVLTDELPEGWHYVPFSQLSSDNCADYEKIRSIVSAMGYIVD